MLDEINLRYLWDLFRDGFAANHHERVTTSVTAGHDRLIALPAAIDSLVRIYRSDGDQKALQEVALIAVEGFYFDTERHTRLVAYLVSQKKLTIALGYELLDFGQLGYDTLHPDLCDVADALWLMREDSDITELVSVDYAPLAIALSNVARIGFGAL
jgi:hypothetical protein